MALGTFSPPPATGKAGQFKPQENAGKPIIAVPREYKEGFTSAQYKDPKDVLIYDVVDLTNGAVIPNVITGSGAIRDRLARYLPGRAENQTGEPMAVPVKIVPVTRPGQNTYYSVDGLEGQELALAGQWYQQFGMGYIDQTRAQVAAAAEAAAQAAAAPQQTPWQAQAMGQPPAQNWQAPAAQAPVQNPGPTWNPNQAQQPAWNAVDNAAPAQNWQVQAAPQQAVQGQPQPAQAAAPVAQPSPYGSDEALQNAINSLGG